MVNNFTIRLNVQKNRTSPLTGNTGKKSHWQLNSAVRTVDILHSGINSDCYRAAIHVFFNEVAVKWVDSNFFSVFLHNSQVLSTVLWRIETSADPLVSAFLSIPSSLCLTQGNSPAYLRMWVFAFSLSHPSNFPYSWLKQKISYNAI